MAARLATEQNRRPANLFNSVASRLIVRLLLNRVHFTFVDWKWSLRCVQIIGHFSRLSKQCRCCKLYVRFGSCFGVHFFLGSLNHRAYASSEPLRTKTDIWVSSEALRTTNALRHVVQHVSFWKLPNKDLNGAAPSGEALLVSLATTYHEPYHPPVQASRHARPISDSTCTVMLDLTSQFTFLSISIKT